VEKKLFGIGLSCSHSFVTAGEDAEDVSKATQAAELISCSAKAETPRASVPLVRMPGFRSESQKAA
jgi:hypothetical protein